MSGGEHAVEHAAQPAAAPVVEPGAGVVPPSVAMALRLQRSAGNAATAAVLAGGRSRAPARAIQRDDDIPQPGDLVVPDETRRPRAPHKPTGNQDIDESAESYAAIAAALAAARYENPLHKELTYHYVYGEGAVFVLTRDKMVQVQSPGSTRLNILGGRLDPVNTAVRELKDDIWAQREALNDANADPAQFVASTQVTASGPTSCDSDKPSLGGFTFHVDGLLEATFSANGEDILYTFTGVMHWTDRWDFDPMRKAGPGEAGTPAWRTPEAEKDTRLAAAALPGLAFEIQSDEVQVTQTGHQPIVGGFIMDAPDW